MKVVIMQFSPISRHFISLRIKYSPQHPVLQYPQSYVLSETKFPHALALQKWILPTDRIYGLHVIISTLVNSH
jgi:hypothetical protein